MIEATALTKRYGDKLAVDDLSFVVRPGVVTGFLGPNGAGKSTTMRMILGLDRADRRAPSRSTARRLPQTSCGRCMRSAPSSRPGRSTPGGRRLNHLLGPGPDGRDRAAPGSTRCSSWSGSAMSPSAGPAGSRSAWGSGSGSPSALLGDPQTLRPRRAGQRAGPRWHPLDPEPAASGLAAEGRTVFVSSHLMSEMALTAEHLIVIGRGRAIADTSAGDSSPEASGQRGAGALPQTGPARLSPRTDAYVTTTADDAGSTSPGSAPTRSGSAAAARRDRCWS